MVLLDTAEHEPSLVKLLMRNATLYFAAEGAAELAKKALWNKRYRAHEDLDRQ